MQLPYMDAASYGHMTAHHMAPSYPRCCTRIEAHLNTGRRRSGIGTPDVTPTGEAVQAPCNLGGANCCNHVELMRRSLM